MEQNILSTKNLFKKYSRKGTEINALNGVDLQVPQGAILGIIGKNGAGKSTLFRCLVGLESPDSGSVAFDGKELQFNLKNQIQQFRKKIGVVFQHLHLFNSRTVRDNIAYPLEIDGVPREERYQRVDKLLSLLGLDGKGHQYPQQLSGGQKQRVAIARAVIHNPKLLLCDEATSALDPETLSALLEVFHALRKELNLTIVLITHYPEIVNRLCTHLAVVNAGIVELQGDKKSVLLHYSKENGFVTHFIDGGRHVA
jgi:D-methionine transport system ATP-binding protein